MTVYNPRNNKRERIGRLLEMHANHRQESKYVIRVTLERSSVSERHHG